MWHFPGSHSTHFKCHTAVISEPGEQQAREGRDLGRQWHSSYRENAAGRQQPPWAANQNDLERCERPRDLAVIGPPDLRLSGRFALCSAEQLSQLVKNQ